MNHKTIEEYFCERKLRISSIVYVDGIDYMVIKTDDRTLRMLCMNDGVANDWHILPHGTDPSYVTHLQLKELTCPEDIVRIRVGHPDNCESIPIDEYFGERKIPIGTLVILDGREYRVIGSINGRRCSIVDTDLWMVSGVCNTMSSEFTDGIAESMFRFLVIRYKSVLIGDDADEE